MLRIRLLLLCLFVLLLSFPALGQKFSMDSLYAYSTKKTIPIAYLCGQWACTDSVSHQIEFTLEDYALLLKPGIDTRPYTFSLRGAGAVSSLGMIINWPPFYAQVSVLDENNIEIHYFEAVSSSSLLSYRYTRNP